MTRHNGIRNEEMNEAIKGFMNLRREYESQVEKLKGRGIRKDELEKKKMAMQEHIFSRKNFERVLQNDAIVKTNHGLINEAIIDENNLYALNDVILRRLDCDYRTFFLYTGRCGFCGNETEKKIPVEKPVLDYRYINDPIYFNEFFHDTKCVKCNKTTDPIKTLNLFELRGENEYQVRLTLARRKSQGRIVTKLIEMCAGRQKDIKDINGFMLVSQKERTSKKARELLLKYHGEDGLECNDYFDYKRYIFYIGRNGKARESHIRDIESKERICFDRRGHKTKDAYRAIHTPLNFGGTVIEVQLKDLEEWKKENDPKSPLYHGTYRKIRDDASSMYHEEFKEVQIRSEWGPFERKLERFLVDSKLFEGYNPNLYVREMLPAYLVEMV